MTMAAQRQHRGKLRHCLSGARVSMQLVAVQVGMESRRPELPSESRNLCNFGEIF